MDYYLWLEFFGLNLSVIVLCWLIHRTTNFFYYVGLSDKKKVSKTEYIKAQKQLEKRVVSIDELIKELEQGGIK
tara:strand:- start:595 stop:816 length:222 start_codon:yes stop_codon:yes gene_type:complete